MKGCGYQDATFESALDAISYVSHAARLKDLVGPLYAQSVLTIGDFCPPMFPEAAIHTLILLLGFDVRAGIKADGSDFYAINYKPYGSPINRPRPLTVHCLDCFPYEHAL